MKKLFPLGACFAFARLISASEAGENAALVCRQNAAYFSGAESTGDIKYAPDRKVDIEHVAIDVTPDFEKRTVRGEVTLTFKPIAKPLDELRLDAVDLEISEVTGSAKIKAHQNTGKEIVVTFAEP